ncbi:MAG: hypothetical protein RSB20_01480 [Clostridia bacterium]
MFKKFGTFFKIDNNNINNNGKKNYATEDNEQNFEQFVETSSAQTPPEKPPKEQTLSDEQTVGTSYQDYIARHRRLSEEIDRANQQKNK